MNDPELLKALARHPFMAGLSQAQIEFLAGCARQVAMSAGTVLAVERGSADAFYLIESGRVAIEVHVPHRGKIQVETVGPGGVVGWSWLIPPHQWHFDARAVEPTATIVLDAVCLRDHCKNDSALGYELLSRLITIIAGRLTATRLQLLDVYK
jgi:CRP/FNR family cyclic AMP-dependent transcriptional regulator